MKTVKLTSVLLLIVLFALALTGCGYDKPYYHQFRQPRENVEKVEICTFDEYKIEIIEPIAKLSDTEIDSFLNDISLLEGYKFAMFDPILSYGDLAIVISYTNGEKEIIGLTNIGFLSPDGELTTSSYSYHFEDIIDIMVKYVDKNLLDENSQYGIFYDSTT